MDPRDIQLPKGMVLILNGKDEKAKKEAWADIINFAEPDNVLNLGGRYVVTYRVCTFNGKPKSTSRSFHSKTYADYFIALLGERGATVESGPELKVDLIDPRVAGMHLVNAYGSIEEAVRGVE